MALCIAQAECMMLEQLHRDIFGGGPKEAPFG